MRRQLIVTVAAVVSMVLLAMLVPMAVLVRSYALEDRLSRAALEVQATETVVSGQDKGDVSVYVDEINAADDGTRTTVLYADGTGDRSEPRRGRPAWPRRDGPARPASTTWAAGPRSWCRCPSAAAPANPGRRR